MDAPRGEFERERGEVRREDLGRRVRGDVGLHGRRPEPVADARPEPPRPTAPLIGRGVRDADRFQPRHPAVRIEARRPREPAVDDDTDALDRQARLGDRRGEDDFARARRARHDRTVLRVLRQVSVERGEGDARWQPTLAQHRLGAADLTRAGEKHEHIPVVLGERAAHGSDGVGLDPPVRLRHPVEVVRLDGVRAALARQ